MTQIGCASTLSLPSDEPDRDFNVAAHRPRKRTNFMGGVDDLLRELLIDARNAHVQPGAKRVAAFALTKIDLGIDACIGRQRQIPSACCDSHRTSEACRP